MALGEAFDELKKVELLDERDQMREREAENAAEQAELDFDRPDAGAQRLGGTVCACYSRAERQQQPGIHNHKPCRPCAGGGYGVRVQCLEYLKIV